VTVNTLLLAQCRQHVPPQLALRVWRSILVMPQVTADAGSEVRRRPGSIAREQSGSSAYLRPGVGAHTEIKTYSLLSARLIVPALAHIMSDPRRGDRHRLRLWN
jgi:hypothetical protein